jgi:hypothetical protein
LLGRTGLDWTFLPLSVVLLEARLLSVIQSSTLSSPQTSTTTKPSDHQPRPPTPLNQYHFILRIPPTVSTPAPLNKDMPYPIRYPQKNPQPSTPTTPTPVPPQARQQNIQARRSITLWIIFFITSNVHLLFCPPLSANHRWLIWNSFCFPVATVASLPAEREGGLCSTVRDVVRVWCVWPKLEAGNFWCMLGLALVLFALMRAVLEPWLDLLLEFLPVEG